MTYSSPDEPLDSDAQRAAATPQADRGEAAAEAESAADLVGVAAGDTLADEDDEDDGTPAELADPSNVVRIAPSTFVPPTLAGAAPACIHSVPFMPSAPSASSR